MSMATNIIVNPSLDISLPDFKGQVDSFVFYSNLLKPNKAKN